MVSVCRLAVVSMWSVCCLCAVVFGAVVVVVLVRCNQVVVRCGQVCVRACVCVCVCCLGQNAINNSFYD